MKALPVEFHGVEANEAQNMAQEVYTFFILLSIVYTY